MIRDAETLQILLDSIHQFVDEVLAPDVLMLLPGGMVIDDRAQVVASMGGAPWQSHQLSDERVVPLGTDAAVVAYRATAVRADTPYTALFDWAANGLIDQFFGKRGTSGQGTAGGGWLSALFGSSGSSQGSIMDLFSGGWGFAGGGTMAPGVSTVEIFH